MVAFHLRQHQLQLLQFFVCFFKYRLNWEVPAVLFFVLFLV